MGDAPVAVRMVIDVLFVAGCAVPQVLVWMRQLCPHSFISWDVVDIPVVAQRLVC